MATFLTALLLIPGTFGLPGSSFSNGASCVTRVPQPSPTTGLKMTIWDQSNCTGSAGPSYPLTYEQNFYQNASFKSYTLSRTYFLHPIPSYLHCPQALWDMSA